MTIAAERLERIYRKGFTAADYQHLKPNTLLVSPVAAPQTMGGITMPGSSVCGANALLYRVERHGHVVGRLGEGEGLAFAIVGEGDTHDAVLIRFAVGDIVTVRNGMLEPVHPEGALLVIDVRHVLAVLSSDEADGGERAE